MNQSNECLSFGSDKNVLKTVVKIAERPTFHKMEAVWPVLFMVSWLSSYGKAAPNGNEGPQPANVKFQSAAGLSVPRPDESNPRVDHPDAAPLPIAQRPDVVAPPIPRVVPASNSNNLANNNIDSPKFIPASNHPPAAIDQPGPPSAVIAAIRGEPKPPIAPSPDQIQEENQRQQEVPEAAAAKQEVEKNQLNPAVEEASHREEEGDLPTINDSVDSSRVVEGMGENRIAAEIADLQRKLGDLQSNIDQVLNEGNRKKREAGKADDVVTMGKQLDELLKTVGSLQNYLSKKLRSAEASGGQGEEKSNNLGKKESGDSGKEEHKNYSNTSKPSSYKNESNEKTKEKELEPSEGSGDEQAEKDSGAGSGDKDDKYDKDKNSKSKGESKRRLHKKGVDSTPNEDRVTMNEEEQSEEEYSEEDISDDLS